MGKGSRTVSFVGRLSLSRRVLYRRFHCRESVVQVSSSNWQHAVLIVTVSHRTFSSQCLSGQFFPPLSDQSQHYYPSVQQYVRPNSFSGLTVSIEHVSTKCYCFACSLAQIEFFKPASMGLTWQDMTIFTLQCLLSSHSTSHGSITLRLLVSWFNYLKATIISRYLI